MTKSGCAIRLGVKKRLGKFTLDCQLDIVNGITAIFGPSGSGKTTLLDLICGLFDYIIKKFFIQRFTSLQGMVAFDINTFFKKI